MTFFEGRCLACWRIPDEVGITECCFGCLVTCWLSSYLEKNDLRKWFLHFKEGNTSDKILHGIQYTAEVPVTLIGSECSCNLTFLLSFIHLWQFGWNNEGYTVQFICLSTGVKMSKGAVVLESSAQLVEKRFSYIQRQGCHCESHSWETTYLSEVFLKAEEA